MAAISWSIKSHGMLFMEHDEPDQPWKIFHDHAMIVERQSCSIDHEKVTMIFLDHGKAYHGFDHWECTFILYENKKNHLKLTFLKLLRLF